MSNNELLVNPAELTMVKSVLNPEQMGLLLKRTPERYIRKRPAKGGGEWDYVSIGYVTKCLNVMFGFDWDFEILEQLILNGEAIVKGKLTVRVDGRAIVKTNFGNKDIIYKKLAQGETEKQPLSIGNDLKAAASDCLKKCASMIGIAADIYNRDEFREVLVDTSEPDWEKMSELLSKHENKIHPDDYEPMKAAIEQKNLKKYSKIEQALIKFEL